MMLCSRLPRNLKVSSDCPKHEATLIFGNIRALQAGHPAARAVTFKSPYRTRSEILASKTRAGPEPVTSPTTHATQFLLFKPKALSSARKGGFPILPAWLGTKIPSYCFTIASFCCFLWGGWPEVTCWQSRIGPQA